VERWRSDFQSNSWQFDNSCRLFSWVELCCLNYFTALFLSFAYHDPEPTFQNWSRRAFVPLFTS
jgi:hypothetical protein